MSNPTYSLKILRTAPKRSGIQTSGSGSPYVGISMMDVWTELAADGNSQINPSHLEAFDTAETANGKYVNLSASEQSISKKKTFLQGLGIGSEGLITYDAQTGMFVFNKGIRSAGDIVAYSQGEGGGSAIDETTLFQILHRDGNTDPLRIISKDYLPSDIGVDMSTIWSKLAANTTEQINLSHLTTALSGYVLSSSLGDAAYRGVYDKSSVGHLDWSTYRGNLITNGALAFWDGRYNSSASNLAYCNKGAFGSIVTKNTGDYLPIAGGTLTGKLLLKTSSNHTSRIDFLNSDGTVAGYVGRDDSFSTSHLSLISETSYIRLRGNSIQIGGRGGGTQITSNAGVAQLKIRCESAATEANAMIDMCANGDSTYSFRLNAFLYNSAKYFCINPATRPTLGNAFQINPGGSIQLAAGLNLLSNTTNTYWYNIASRKLIGHNSSGINNTVVYGNSVVLRGVSSEVTYCGFGDGYIQMSKADENNMYNICMGGNYNKDIVFRTYNDNLIIASPGANTGKPIYFRPYGIGYGTNQMLLNADGSLTVSGDVVAYSDKSLKKNIQTLKSRGLVRPVLFNWKDETKGTDNHIGFIAQEMEEVYPELVSTDENGVKSVNYAAYTAVLQAQIDELKAMVYQLMGEK
ncbi:MAG: tail fiber domain-containing protein [Marinilabiliaceae bacterium]|nr:tail fiber domain-containing protein [Marinilabiliaceae bacterium]